MNCDVNYNGEIEGKNTHPKLLTTPVEMMSTESVELLVKSGLTSILRTSDNPTYVPASNRVTFRKQPQAHRRSVLSNDRIAELKNRIDRSCKIRLAKPNGRIVERSRSSGRSTDTRLLGQ